MSRGGLRDGVADPVHAQLAVAGPRVATIFARRLIEDLLPVVYTTGRRSPIR
jgi:hypothetical protein